MMANVLMGCTGYKSDVIEHRSMPGHAGWWDWPEYTNSRFIIITRRMDMALWSARSHDHPLYEMQSYAAVFERALITLAGFPNAYWVTYEAVVANPVQQFANITTWLGNPYDPSYPEAAIRDENAKWSR